MIKNFKCEKYGEYIDTEKRLCPHQTDYCPYRGSCIINYLYKESLKYGEEKEEKIEDTR